MYFRTVRSLELVLRSAGKHFFKSLLLRTRLLLGVALVDKFVIPAS